MLRPHYAIQLSLEERQQLAAVLRAGKTQQRVVLRAAAILLADNGLKNQEIADELATSRNWVQKWRKRFAQHELKTPPPGQEANPLARLQALDDLPRSGRPAGFSPSGPPPGGECGLSEGAGLQRVFALQRTRPGTIGGRTRRHHHDEPGNGPADFGGDGAETASISLLVDPHRSGV